jgi:lactate permease
MDFLLALLPILVILVLMVGLRWSATRAGAAGYLCGLAIAVLFFGATPELLAYAHAKGLLFSIDVLMIIWAAFLLYRVVDEAGAIRTIGQALPRLTPDPVLQTLILGWVFASFLQGVGGFGVPVAVVSPLLVSLGLSPLVAVLAPSLGHGWAVTFGSMGSSFQSLMAATGQPAEALAPPAALFLGSVCPVMGLMIVHATGGWKTVRRLFLPVLAWGGIMGGVQYLVATSGAWNIGAFIGGLAGLLVTPLLVRATANHRLPAAENLQLTSNSDPLPVTSNPTGYVGERTQSGERGTDAGRHEVRNLKFKINQLRSDILDQKPLFIALSGYVILIVLTLVVQLIPEVKRLFGQVVLQVQFPETRSTLGYITPAGAGRKISLFGHTGSLLLYTSILAYLVYRLYGLYQPGSVRRILEGTVRRVMSSSVSIVSMICMALVMEHAGMTDRLARGLAEGTQALFPIFSPWIGAIGAFMTGSNTNSNVVFGALQMHTAQFLGYAVPVILAAQTAGAALASVAAPAKVVVGASTAGMAGKEGEVLRQLSPYVAILVLLISAFTVLMILK